MADGRKRLRNPVNAEKLRLNRNAQKHDIRTAGELISIRLSKGDFFTVACGRAGVPVKTAREWLTTGRRGLGSVSSAHRVCREEHVWFYEEVTRVLAEVEGNAVDAWTDEIQRGNWQAARDFLARRFRKRWGNSEHRELPVRSEAPAEIQLTWGDELEGENPGGQIDYEVLFTPFAGGAGGGNALPSP